MLEVRLLSSTGITRRLQYYEPVRHPRRPSLLLTEFWLRATTSLRWGFPCSDDFLFHACRRHYPGGTVGCCRYPVQRRRPSPKTRRVGFRIILFEACSAFTHVSACMVAKSPKVTRYTRVLHHMSLPPCGALVASGRATDWPGGIRTHWRSPTFTAYWFFRINRDFPYGLSLEPIQTRNVRDYNNTTSPSLMRVDFSTSFPSSSPSDPGTVPIGAFSSGQRVFCADHLDEEPRFPPFTPLQLHVT